MLGLGGQLGVNALGAFELAMLQIGTTFVPHRGRPHSAVSRTGLLSTASRAQAGSVVSSSRFGSAISRTRVGSSVSSSRVGSEVGDE